MKTLRILLAIGVAASLNFAADKRAKAQSSLGVNDEGKISFPVSRPFRGKQINGVGTLSFPDADRDKFPLIVIVHGTAGVQSREQVWAQFFQNRGAATFVLDYFSPRGTSGQGRNVPRPPEDIHGALKRLSTHPRIDTGNVAVIGFSNGASVTATAANFSPETDTNGVVPKAYIMLYGGCSVEMYFARDTAPHVLFIAGGKDDLVGAKGCMAAAKHYRIKNGRGVIIPDAYHGFDSFRNATFNHPKWGRVTMRHSDSALAIARKEVTDVLDEAFDPKFSDWLRQQSAKFRDANLNGTWTGVRACQGIESKTFEAVAKDGKFAVDLGGVIREKFTGEISETGEVTLTGSYVSNGETEKIAYAGQLPNAAGKRTAMLKGAEGSSGCNVTLTSK